MSTEAGPALRWPFRIACAGLGVLISWMVWAISASWPVNEDSRMVRAFAALVLGAPFLALAVLGAGPAVVVPEGGEDVLEAEWVRAHPWQARLKWFLTVAAGGYGAVRAGAALGAGQRIPVDSIVACVVGVLTTGALVARWRRRAGRIATDAAASTLSVPAPELDSSADRERRHAAPGRRAP